MKLTAMQLKEIAFMCGNVVINTDDYTVLQINDIPHLILYSQSKSR